MSRTLSGCLLALFAIAAVAAFIGCARNVPKCPPGSLVETKVVRFICPRCGAEYEVNAMKCAGGDHYWIDTTCPVCGYNYLYNIPRWPYPYVWDDYYFYNGFWYQHDYWNRYWRYGYRAPVTPTPPPTTMPPRRPPQPPPQPRVPIRQPQPPRSGNMQRPPIPAPPPAPIMQREAPSSPPPAPPPVPVRPTPEAPPAPVKK
jgi:predicted RNA-binding Zn-ribbon protein involved in translation (DUF1610 family)